MTQLQYCAVTKMVVGISARTQPTNSNVDATTLMLMWFAHSAISLLAHRVVLLKLLGWAYVVCH